MMMTTVFTGYHTGLPVPYYDANTSRDAQLSTPLDDDVVWTSPDVCSSLWSVERQPPTFHSIAQSSSCQATRDDDRVDGASLQSDDAITSSSWSLTDNVSQLMSYYDEFDLVMTSWPGCHNNHDDAAADWLSELDTVSLLADEVETSACDSMALVDHPPPATVVPSPSTSVYRDTDSDQGSSPRHAFSLYSVIYCRIVVALHCCNYHSKFNRKIEILTSSRIATPKISF